jgi:hypothetical protein
MKIFEEPQEEPDNGHGNGEGMSDRFDRPEF